MKRIPSYIKRIAMFNQTPLTLNYIYKHSCTKNLLDQDKIAIAKFTQNEIPVRLAHRVIQLNSLPNHLVNDRLVIDVQDLYIDSLNRINKFSIHNLDDAEKMADELEGIKKRHSDVAHDISLAVQCSKDIRYEDDTRIDSILNKFYMSRIGIRTLIGSYLSTVKGAPSVIEKDCKPYDVISGAVKDCKDICAMNYASVPNLIISGNEDYTFTYIPSHLYYIVTELVKNSMRGIMDNGGDGDIKVMMSEGEDDLILKISDTGKGFPRSDLQKVFRYYYTTAHIGNMNSVPMAGFGHGLPLARLYSRYLGGDLHLIPYHGFGTDAIVYINKLGDSKERLL